MGTNTLAQAIVTTFKSMMADIHTCLPGRVEKYEYKTQKAEVKPLIKKKFLNGDSLDIPVIPNVPVVFPRTKKAGFTFPLNKGDGVLLVFSERSLERWLSSGDDVEPGDPRKFDLTDAIAIPGLFSFSDSNIASNNNDVEIHNEGQTITIKKNGDIEVGGSSLKKLVMEDMLAKFNSHVHTATSFGTATSPPQQGASDVPPYPAPMVLGNTELTSKVKAQ